MHEKVIIVDEYTEKDVKLNQGEINALKKAILYLKFECEEESSLIFSGSELINSAFEKLLSNSDSYVSELNFYSKGNAYAEDFMLEKLKRQKDFYGESDDNKECDTEYVKICIYPYKKIRS